MKMLTKNSGAAGQQELSDLEFQPFPHLERVLDDVRYLDASKATPDPIIVSGWVHEVETGKVASSRITVWLLDRNRVARSYTNSSFRSRCLKAAFVFIFSLLRPEDLLQPDGSHHHSNHEEPGQNQYHCHDTANDLNRSSVKGSTNGER